MRVMALAALVTLATGCGSSSGGSGGGKPRIGDFKLTGDEARHFEQWKKAPLKSCQVDHAFDGKHPSLNAAGVDARVLFEKTGSSLVLKTDDGFVALDQPRALSGQGTSELTRSTTVNGQGDSFGARMTQSGSHCKVEIGGKVVYETELFAALPVMAHGRGTIVEPKTSRHYVRSRGDVLEEHGLIDSFAVQRIRSNELREQLEQYFPDWSKEEREQFFPVPETGWSLPAHAVELGAGLPLVSGAAPQIPGGEQAWSKLASTRGDTSYTLLVAAPRVKAGDVSNTGDQHLWRINVTSSWTADAGDVRDYRVTAISWGDQGAEDAGRLARCFEKRHAAFAETAAFGTGALAPSFQGTVAPCTVLAADSDAALYADGAARELIGRKFRGVSGGDARMAWLGWDEALKGMALTALAKGDDLRAKVDPDHGSPLIDALGTNVTAVAKAASEHQEIKTQTTRLVTTLAFPWSFQGTDVSPARIDAIIDAVANAIEPFALSVGAWLGDLAADPDQQADQIAFAAGLGADLKSSVKALLAQATEAGVGGVFEDEKLARVIQDQVDVAARLPAWQATLAALKDFRVRDEAKASNLSKLSYESKLGELAKTAVREDWTGTEFAATDAIASFGRKKSFCAQYPDTVSVVDCVDRRRFTKEKGGFFDPRFGNRYADAARTFAKLHGDLSGATFVFIQQDLEGSFFEPVWQGCANDQFAAQLKELAGLVAKLKAAQGFSRYDVEREIGSLLDRCRT